MNAREKLESKTWLDYDPLYLYCKSREEIRKILFPDFLEMIKADEQLSTRDASVYLNKTEANLRYYLRVLYDYINPQYVGRRYRLDVESFYRLYLVSLLLDDNQSVHDITVRVGLKTPISETTYSDRSSQVPTEGIASTYEYQVLQVKQHINHLENKKNTFYNKKLSDLREIDKEITEVRFKLNDLTIELSRIETKLDMERLRERNNDLAVKVYRKTLKEKKRGFFDLFKKDIDEAEDLNFEELKQEKEDQELTKKITELENEKEDMVKTLEILEEKKAEKEREEMDEEELKQSKRAIEEYERPRLIKKRMEQEDEMEE